MCLADGISCKLALYFKPWFNDLTGYIGNDLIQTVAAYRYITYQVFWLSNTSIIIMLSNRLVLLVIQALDNISWPIKSKHMHYSAGPPPSLFAVCKSSRKLKYPNTFAPLFFSRNNSFLFAESPYILPAPVSRISNLGIVNPTRKIAENL